MLAIAGLGFGQTCGCVRITMAGTGAGLLAGLIGIGGGIVVVPVVYYGLTSSGISIDRAAHVAVATSLAAILPRPKGSKVDLGVQASPPDRVQGPRRPKPIRASRPSMWTSW
jgi:hypothetical protein